MGSGSQAHTGWLHADWGERVGLESWLFRATVGIAGGHSQLLQYLKWFNNMRGENREFKIKGKPRRGEAAHMETGKSFWCLVCSPDPGWPLLPCPAWRAHGPQCGIPRSAWCCMEGGCWPGGCLPHPQHLPWIGLKLPFTIGFLPSGGSRKPGSGASPGDGRGRHFPHGCALLVRSHGAACLPHLEC